MLRLALLVLCVVFAQTAQAQTSTPSAATSSTADKVWTTLTEWYSDTSNPVIQSVRLSGRYQHEFAAVDADAGSHREWNIRRIRVGTRVNLFRSYLLHVELDLNPQEHDPFYLRLTDAYVKWTRDPQLAITVGKQPAPFTLEGATSSKELISIDRSNLANNLWFPQEYMPGISASGRSAAWSYFGGVYSAGAADREFGHFNGGFFTVADVGYDFAKTLGLKNAVAAANYVYQRPDPDNSFTRRLEHVLSLNLKLDGDGWGVRGDVAGGMGYLGQSDLWGVMVMPFVDLTPKWQLVCRYTMLDSARPNGLYLAAYESRVVHDRGDRYNELYAGVNWYIWGHRLKLQSGLAFADMADRADDGGKYRGISFTSGVRVGW